ncbi:MAG: GNAT family N-acetyltransferase, partial [Firmicutes bacterium]|nr:GNAT family N-acetyltransferase [Bacillota bacterium]
MDAKIDITNTVLETERLILRPWKESDLQDFFEYASVDGVGQMAGWLPHESIEQSRDILSRFIAHKHTFALELKENGKVIGSLGIESSERRQLPEPYASRMGR